MRIAILGTHGIPAQYGGFETFAEEVAIRLIKKGIDVTIFCDKCDSEKLSEYKGVKLEYMNYTKSANPLLYYFKSIIKAGKNNDFILICGSGGSIFLLFQLLPNKVKYVINVDGIEYLRDKWSIFQKIYLRLSEFIAMHKSDYIISDSLNIKRFLLNKYSVDRNKVIQIEYGANIVEYAKEEFLSEYRLIPYNYFLVVSRLEPENNVEKIIDGYLKSANSMPLVIIGNLRNTNYVENLKKFSSDKIIFPGGIYEREKLEALRFYCKAYLHGHSVGGTNPSLLEALGCGNIVIAHDNLFNREVTENKMFYFKNSTECASVLKQVCELDTDSVKKLKEYAFTRIKNYYNWDRITEEYYKLFIKNHS